MDSGLLDGIAVFVAVVKLGSFTAAAEHLGHSTSWVSKAISRLEQRQGVRLLNRTTRTISLTDPGKAYFERCEQIVIDAENAERSMGQMQETPRGLLRVNAPLSFGIRYMGDLLPEFMNRHPVLKLEVEYNDRYINVVEEGFDVVIRVGDTQDSSLVAKRITSSRGVTVASPGYLGKYGRPQTANDLKQHACICYGLLPNPTVWEYNRGFDKERVQVEPRLVCNTAELEVAMALNDGGITRLPLYCVEQYIASGALEIVLADYQQPELPVYAVYPHRQYLSAKVRAFVDFLSSSFAEENRAHP